MRKRCVCVYQAVLCNGLGFWIAIADEKEKLKFWELGDGDGLCVETT